MAGVTGLPASTGLRNMSISPNPCCYSVLWILCQSFNRWTVTRHCFAIIQLLVVSNIYIFSVCLAVGFKPLVNSVPSAKLLMHHKNSALIKLAQNPKPHEGFHKTEDPKAQGFFKCHLSLLSGDGRIQGQKATRPPSQHAIHHLASRGSCCINNSPTLSVSSAFKIENKSVHAVFLTTVFILKKHTHTTNSWFCGFKKTAYFVPSYAWI